MLSEEDAEHLLQLYKVKMLSSIAQSVEHAAVNRAVVGSSPTRGVQKLRCTKHVKCELFWAFLKRKRLLGQAVKTSPFHGGNTGSIPVGVIRFGLYTAGQTTETGKVESSKKKLEEEICRCGSIGRAADL